MSNEEDRKAPSDLVPLMGGLLAAAKRADYYQTGEALLLLKAADTLKQMQTDLDARFEHSDHTAAKYYQRMRAAEKESVMRRSESADLEKERDEAVERLEAAGSTPQDITDAMVERAAKATFEVGAIPGDYTWVEMVRENPARAEIWRDDARVALTAALGVTK